MDDRLRFLFAKSFERALPTDDCPPPERLLDAVQARLPTDALAAVLDHLAVCPVCAEAWRIAQLAEGPG